MHQRTATFQVMLTMTKQFTQLNQAIVQGVKMYNQQLVETGMLARPKRIPQIKPTKPPTVSVKPTHEADPKTAPEPPKKPENNEVKVEKNG